MERMTCRLSHDLVVSDMASTAEVAAALAKLADAAASLERLQGAGTKRHRGE
jgi:hypothetical protein